MSIYLDWNATTSRHALVIERMQEAEALAWANPSSIHRAGRDARRFVEDAREHLAKVMQRSSRDVLFTGGGTEANHLALNGASKLVTSRIEHPSIVAQAEAMQLAGAQVVFADVDHNGVVTAQAVEAALKELGLEAQGEIVDRSLGGFNNRGTPLVALMAVNHETGVIQPLKEVHALVQRYGARLHVDAVQWVGKRDAAFLNHADSVSLTAHKFRGPKGIGALLFDCGWSPLPLGRGGAQERGLRPGTVDATAAAGLDAAVGRFTDTVPAFEKAAQLGQFLEQELLRLAQCEITIHGSNVPRIGHVVNFRAAGWKGDELVVALDLDGICVSSGSACSAGTAEPSSIISAMLGREAAVGAVRISLGEESTRTHIEALLTSLQRLKILKSS